MTSALIQLFQKPRFSHEPSLERRLALLEALTLDPTKIQSIGITGSNGKGSTAHMLSAILSGHGIKTGLFTSPHLIIPNERFRINGKAIPENELEHLAREVLTQAENIEKKLSQEFSRFELLTILAFLHFRNEKVDIAILEAGIGGRLDPTRLAFSKLSAITSLELEHADILGDTLEKIFTEKLLLVEGGGHSFISMPTNQQLRERCSEIAKLNDITLKFIDEEHQSFKCYQDRDNTLIDLKGERFKIPLLGNWQGRNLLMALTLAKKVIPEEKFSIKITQDSLDHITIPGRFEKINSTPDIYVDAAHTPEAIREVVSLIKTREKGGTYNFAILLGILKDKSVHKMLEYISDLDAPFFISSANQGGVEPEMLAEILKNHGKTILAADIDLLKVFNQAKNYATERGGTIYVLGGLSFVGDVCKLRMGQK